MKIRAFTKYGSEAASTRQRILQYAEPLANAGIDLECEALLGNDYVRSLAEGWRFSRARIAASYWARMRSLLTGPRADIYWVYADLFPYFPAAFDRLLFRLDRPVVIDWDDAFFEAYAGHRSPLVRFLFRTKLDRLLSSADAITCGNSYLADHARKFGIRSLVVPTVVDTDKVCPCTAQKSDPPVIGWIGSASTWPYVRPLLPLLAPLVEESKARVLIVGAGHAARADRNYPFEFRDWSMDREVADLQAMDIGIMPVPDQPWERGKSGYKLVQYMATGLPCVASPVGANREIVLPGETGIFATDAKEWETALRDLLDNPESRQKLGAAGRQRAVESFSLKSQAPRLIDLFRSLDS